MISEEKRLIRALRGKPVDRPPFWFMRQAGRYLPEYRELRAKFPKFLDFCYTPDAAAEATLQPIRRYGMDAAIIFSDILVIPHALGMDVGFNPGHGPSMTPLADVAMLDASGMKTFLSPVYEALRKTKAALPEETALIGFCGAPWTLACYMAQGQSSNDFAAVKEKAKRDPAFFADLFSVLEDAVAKHAIAQVEAGAEVIQLFDSWAGVLNEAEFETLVAAPTRRIVAAIKKAQPQVPIIGFPRQSGSKILGYAKHTGVDAVSFDDSVPLAWVREQLQPVVAVQGNLGNALLAGERSALLAEAAQIVRELGDKAFVFNLGHGILPTTPPENVQALCEFLKHGQ